MCSIDIMLRQIDWRRGFERPGKDESGAAACLMSGFSEAVIMAR
jgi:hypothetical protein